MSTRKPSRPWRVRPCTVPSSSVDYRSQPAAYKDALELARQGSDVRVYHWEDNRWGLYEIVRAAEVAATLSTREGER